MTTQPVTSHHRVHPVFLALTFHDVDPSLSFKHSIGTTSAHLSHQMHIHSFHHFLHANMKHHLTPLPCFHAPSKLLYFSSFALTHWYVSERLMPNKEDDASSGGSSDDYSYPPPPIPAYTVSLPNSPLMHKKVAPGGKSRSILTPGRVHTAPVIPATQSSSKQKGVSTLPNPVRHCQKESLRASCAVNSSPHHNKPQQQPQKHHQPPGFDKTCSMEELRTTVQTVASSIEHSSQDVRHLEQKMVAATEMITDRVEENIQALNLLAEVVDKLQGIIVARNHTETSPPCRPNPNRRPTPPPRVSSLSPVMIHKPPTPYPRPLSHSSAASSSSSSSSSSYSSSAGSCADSFAGYRSPKGLHGGNKPSKRSEAADHNGHIRFHNGAVARAQQEDKQDCNITGCLTTSKKKKKDKQLF